MREGPDVAFLDVGLPDFDGFEIVRRLPTATRPVAIFLTVRNVRVFDGETVAERQTVVISQGKIAAVGGPTLPTRIHLTYNVY